MPTTWTNVSKPTNTTVSSTIGFTGGEPYGLLLAITQSTETTTSIATAVWTDIAKAGGNVWTDIAKAT